MSLGRSSYSLRPSLRVLTIFSIFLIATIDQVIKHIIRATEPDIVITSFLKIDFVRNYGAGFGFLSGQTGLLIAANIIALAALTVLFIRLKEKRLQLYTAAMIIGGAISNIYDRIVYSYVTDYISFSFWPSFNIADIAITIGALFLLYLTVRDRIEFKGKNRV